MPAIPAFVRECCRRLQNAGYAAYPVGGCVRDFLLGREPGDWDVAASALPEQVTELFEHTVPTGLRHGTVTVLLPGGRVEVTTFRREQGYSDGRHPDAVSFDAGLREDLGRRDFTVNAMALSPDGEVIDPFGGRTDLRKKRIRCVGDPAERFREDALRMLRAVRFSAQLGFEIEPGTLRAVAACAGQVVHVSPERIRVEVEKTITAPQPERGNLLFTLGLLAPWLEEPAAPDLGSLSALPPEPVYRWGALCGKLGGTGLLEKLRPDRKTAETCRAVVQALNAPPPETDAQWRRALSGYGARAMAVAAAVWGRGEELSRVLASAPCCEVGKLALSGRDLMALGLRGPEIGAAQRRLLDHVLDHPEDNRAQTLTRLLRAFQNNGTV